MGRPPLPAYTGDYNVGAVDIEVPCQKRIVSDAVYKDSKEPAFELETVFFTLYYPTAHEKSQSKSKHLWVPRPVDLVAAGYARFAHINSIIIDKIFTFFLWAAAGNVEIPALVDAPVHSATPELKDASTANLLEQAALSNDEDKFPIVVLSHGMAGMRTSYSQYCGELASRGYVVAAIEHRDGSGPGSLVVRSDGSERRILHMNIPDLERDGVLDHEEMKRQQLGFRQAEVEETLRVLHELNAGQGLKLQEMNSRKEGNALHSFANRLDINKATIVGHSYGATLAMQVLKDAGSKRMPIHAGIALDPGKGSGPLNADIEVPTLVVASGSWTEHQTDFYGKPHFQAVKDILTGVVQKGKAAWYMTLLGTSHPSCTDAPVIAPRIFKLATSTTLNELVAIQKYVEVSVDFLRYVNDGEKRGILKEGVTAPEGPLAKDGNGMTPDQTGHWAVHVVPQ